MLRWYSPLEVPASWESSVVTIGKFDGVHLGHREIIHTLTEIAQQRGLATAVVTFDRHPSTVLDPERAPDDIVSTAERLDLLEDHGVDACLVLHFDEWLASLTPEEFVTDILLGTLHAQVVLVGSDFRFGTGATGDIATLQNYAAAYGFEVLLIEDVVTSDAERVSSSAIRAALAEGDVSRAAHMLGRFPRVSAEVVHGEKRGRELGFPTANLAEHATGLIPADGVYAGWFFDGGVRYPAAISVGTNPTFEGVHRRTVEAFLLDQTLDLYGHHVTIEFAQRIRGMVAFEGIDALIAQMQNDVRLTRDILGMEN